jgi:hypothetical protein
VFHDQECWKVARTAEGYSHDNKFQLNGEHSIRGAGNDWLSEQFQAIQPSLTNLDPHLGWMLMLIAAVGLYQVLTVRDRVVEQRG